MHKEQPYFLIDGMPVPKHIANLKCVTHLSEKGLFKTKVNDVLYSNFVGYFNMGATIFFSLPYGCTYEALDSLSEVELRKLSISLVNSIRLFDSHFQSDKEVVFTGSLEAAIRLLEEFEDKGFLQFFLKNHAKGLSGKPNWQKTMKSYLPVQQGSSWIYSDIITRRKVTHQNHEFVLLQKWALNYALTKTYFVTDEFDIEEELLENSLSEIDAKEILQKLLLETNKDHELYVLGLIESLMSDESTESSFAIYTKHFQVIWEKAIQCVLAHNKDLAAQVPSVDWKDNATNLTNLSVSLKEASSQPELDVVFEHKDSNTLYIVDAKYYDLVNRNIRPGVTDLYKQLFYAIAFQLTKTTSKTPENGFIFPILTHSTNHVFTHFSDVQYSHTQENGEQHTVESIPAYFGNITDVFEAFLSKTSLQSKYVAAHARKTTS